MCQTCLGSHSKKTAEKKLRSGEGGWEGERKEEWMERSKERRYVERRWERGRRNASSLQRFILQMGLKGTLTSGGNCKVIKQEALDAILTQEFPEMTKY